MLFNFCLRAIFFNCMRCNIFNMYAFLTYLLFLDGRVTLLTGLTFFIYTSRVNSGLGETSIACASRVLVGKGQINCFLLTLL